MNPSGAGESWSVLTWRRGLGCGCYQEMDEIHLSDGYFHFPSSWCFSNPDWLQTHSNPPAPSSSCSPPPPGNTEFSSSPRQKHEWVPFVFLTSVIPSILPILLPLVWIQVLVWGWGWGHRAPLSLPWLLSLSWLLSLPWPAACVLEFHHLCTISKVSFSQRFVYLSFAH